jgi:hypothetical protein
MTKEGQITNDQARQPADFAPQNRPQLTINYEPVGCLLTAPDDGQNNPHPEPPKTESECRPPLAAWVDVIAPRSLGMEDEM